MKVPGGRRQFVNDCICQSFRSWLRFRMRHGHQNHGNFIVCVGQINAVKKVMPMMAFREFFRGN